MKFYCDSCQAKYSIADEKVRGKVLKVRCKKCSYVITVREPRAPTAAARTARPPALPPALPVSVPWYYSLSGKTFGPYDKSDLVRLFDSGELDDACYVWNETFTAWLPVRQVPGFQDALKRGAMMRPRNATLGVSGELESIRIDQLEQGERLEEQQEEEGVVPGQAGRIDALRERLRQHQSAASAQAPRAEASPSPEARSPFKPRAAPIEDATEQMSLESISDLLDRPAELSEATSSITLDDRVGSSEPDAAAASHVPSGEELLDSLFSPESSPIPDYLGTSSPDNQSVIDFSRLDKKESSATTQDGMFKESAAAFSPPSVEGDHFQTSNSLLIQMSSIQKQGRGKRFALIAALMVLGLGLSAVAVVAAKNARQAKPQGGGQEIYDPSGKDIVFKTYSKEERSAFAFELDEEAEVITASPAEGDTSEGEQEEASSGGERARLAKNTATGSAARSGSSLGGIESLINQDTTKRDDALNSGSRASRGSSSRGLGTKGGESARAVASRTPSSSSKGSTFKAPPTIGGVRGPKFKRNDEIQSPSDAAKPKLGQNGSLSSTDAKTGFKKIGRSVQSCYQKQVTRGLPLDTQKVYLTATIKSDGSVSGLKFEPDSIRSSVFASCLESHRKRGRWQFVEFSGKAVNIRHTYVFDQ